MKKHIPTYKLERFMYLLSSREEELDDYMLDTLTGFDNFIEFKRQALDVKLRQLLQEDEPKYRETIARFEGNAMIKEIAEGIEMSAGIDVQGMDGADFDEEET